MLLAVFRKVLCQLKSLSRKVYSSDVDLTKEADEDFDKEENFNERWNGVKTTCNKCNISKQT